MTLKKSQCAHCYQEKSVGIFEYISAGHTMSLGHCAAHEWQVNRKAEQWQMEAPDPKTSVTHRKLKG